MDESDYFGEVAVIEAMAAEHRALWKSLFHACRAHMSPGMRVLDFGCGNGSMLAYLFNGDGRGWPGCRFDLGVGLDRPALRSVLAEAGERFGGGVPLVFSTAPASAFPGQFDLVLSHEAIYLLASLAGTFRELHSSLKPGGVIAMATGCHLENELYPRWRRAFGRAGVRACSYGLQDYTGALREAGFGGVEVGRLRLSEAEYAEWVEARGGPRPNPDWFASAEEEHDYYTAVGKALIVARREWAPDPPRQGSETPP